MTTETGVTAGGEAIFQTELPADAPETFNSPREAAAYFTSLKEKKSQPAESAPEATAETELSVEDNAAPPDEATGEDKEAAPAEQPPRDLPRSWTKDRAEIWNRLDPAAQDILLEQDRLASIEVRRSQNEAAEERKAAKAEREAAEKARQQYEAKLPQVMQTIQETGPFSDIRSMADVEKLQAEDPFRFQAYQVHQWKLQAVQADLMEAESRKAHEHQSNWAQHVQKENELAAEYIPELADKDKAEKLVSRVAKELLPELGFKSSELDALASGKERLSIYDHRVQRLLADALKLRDIQSATKAVAAKPVPPVQKPGTSRPAGQGVDSERLQTLNRKPELTVKEATELYTLQQRSQRRAS